MNLTKRMVAFIKAARGRDQWRPGLMAMWCSAKLSAAYAIDGFRMHAVKMNPAPSCDFAFRQMTDENGATGFSLVPINPADKPHIELAKPRRRGQSMIIQPRFLIQALKEIEARDVRITIVDWGPDRHGLELTGISDNIGAFYALIMGMDPIVRSADKDWRPWDDA